MFKLAQPLFLICETPLHPGTGSDLGVVDLPIQRERHTDFPKIEGSGLKGGLREAFEENGANKEDIKLTFGPEDGNLHSGALGFTDARLLLFPVKSVKGVFGWVTCPSVIERFARDLAHCKIKTSFDIPAPNTIVNETCTLLINGGKIVLEEYTFPVVTDENTSKLAAWLSECLFPNTHQTKDFLAYWRKKCATDLVVLNNDDFRDFVTLSTEVITRTKINPKTGTVQKGALFTEEYLPTDTIMYSLALATPIFCENKGRFAKVECEASGVLDFFSTELPSYVQLGGNATIGKGIVKTRIYKEEKTS